MTELKIVRAEMKREEDGSYLGKTVFEVNSHKAGYEITFFSTKGKDWDYSLHYAGEPGIEEQLLEVDARLEEDDDWFDTLLDAALDTLPEV
ncbi:MAG: hypothetical protein KZY74_12345 [Paenibacillaceae bacterium]|uniref:Uncharacterized protein n=1 Tax=Paenibacillus mellifer TaxID=2937794 RepID=A0A9X1Y3P3_9BACL|nr:hypothetical protein [Paenibacillus mellifer]MBW4840180.1 hypothetical protein [Paenibacillaceae bacterium]MCK8486757.1 hypothetical protein [Paenibacillus mellifer]